MENAFSLTPTDALLDPQIKRHKHHHLAVFHPIHQGHGLEEGVSTRLLIYAAQLIALGIPPVDAADVAMCAPITDDRELQRSIREIVTTVI